MCSAKQPGAPSSIPPPAPQPVLDRLTIPNSAKRDPLGSARTGKSGLTISRSVGGLAGQAGATVGT